MSEEFHVNNNRVQTYTGVSFPDSKATIKRGKTD